MDLDSLPDARWMAKVLPNQVRGVVADVFSHVVDRMPDRIRRAGAGRMLEQWFRRLVPEIPGRIPTLGDAEFAYQRFAGINPVTVTRARAMGDVPEKLRLPDAMLSPLLGSEQRLAKRVLCGDIFVQRYDALRGLSSTTLQGGKFAAPGNVLLCHAPELDAPFEVVPLAIECPVDRADGATAVFTPLDGSSWAAAKLLMGVADVHIAELCLHLARGHFMLAPFAMAMRRMLHPRHPLHEFLLPHLRFNLFVDLFAWRSGVRETSGILIRTLAGNAAWAQQVTKTEHTNHPYSDIAFERCLERRGLLDDRFDYPYRDDGRLVWAAVQRFVQAWVEHTYPSARTLAADAPVHAFLADAGSPEGGNVNGLLRGARLDSREELIEILTHVLFDAGPLHSMSHYSLAAHLQHVDESPAFLRDNPLAVATDDREQVFGTRRSKGQLGRVHRTYAAYDRLGDYRGSALGRRADLRPMIAAYQEELRIVEAKIEQRNLGRLAPFIHLLPSRLTNGASI